MVSSSNVISVRYVPIVIEIQNICFTAFISASQWLMPEPKSRLRGRSAAEMFSIMNLWHYPSVFSIVSRNNSQVIIKVCWLFDLLTAFSGWMVVVPVVIVVLITCFKQIDP
jgi:hypothetical protein